MTKDFLDLVLAGRHTDPDQVLHRVKIDVLRDADHIDTIPEVKITRDYDSIIGLSTKLPYTVPLSILPVPNFNDCMRRTNHLKVPIQPTVCYRRSFHDPVILTL